MRFRLLPVIVAAVIGLCAQASATREYYLVGLRHVYMFDVWPDAYKQDRKAIEEQYATAVASAQQQYDTDMASIRDEEAKDSGNVHQIDRDAVQQNIEQAISDAADTRDASLSQLYVQCDYVRAVHPEFAVDQDGPYRVMGVDIGPEGECLDVCFYQPYPGYLEPCPYGWTYGRPFPFAPLELQIQLFHSTWLSIGSPVFTPLYYGGQKVVIIAPVRMSVIKNRADWAGGKPPAITEEDRKAIATSKELQRKAGIRAPSSHPGVMRVRSVETPGAISKYAKKPNTDKPAGTDSGSRYSRTPTRPTTGTSGSRPPRASGSGPARGGGDKKNDDKKKGG